MSDQPTPPTPTMPPTDSTVNSAADSPSPDEFDRQMRAAGIIGGLVVLVVVVLIGLASWWMYDHPAETAVIRDMFIIFMAFMLVFNGLVMVVLLFQLARLTNLLQHEIRPILENTNETVQVMRGTAIFLSEYVTEPVVKLNGYVSALGRFIELIIPGAARPPKSES